MGIYVATFILGVLVHFFTQRLFIYYQRFDDINHRSSHNALATRTGGIGVFFCVFIISCYQYFIEKEIFDFSLLIPLSIMFIVGVYDDLYNADFKLKFFLQIVVAKLLIDQGFVIYNFYGLFGLYEIPWLFAQLTTVFVFLVVINAINFIDGIDGLAITEVIKVILITEFFSNTTTPLIALGTITITAVAPLYYFNFRKKGKVFLGDAGSLLLGSLVMVYLLYILGPNYQFKDDYQINKILFAVLIVVYPLIDLLRVFILRIKAGKSPFHADKNHIHHLMLNKITNNHLLVTSMIFVFEITVFSIVCLSNLI